MGEIMFRQGYQPHPFDVICKQNRERVFHFGNDHFQWYVNKCINRYGSAKKRLEKSAIIQEIINMVHSNGGRFIRQQSIRQACFTNLKDQNQGQNNLEAGFVYFEISDKKAADKIGHALRLAVSKRDSPCHGEGRLPSSSNSLPTRTASDTIMSSSDVSRVETFTEVVTGDVRNTIARSLALCEVQSWWSQNYRKRRPMTNCEPSHKSDCEDTNDDEACRTPSDVSSLPSTTCDLDSLFNL